MSVNINESAKHDFFSLTKRYITEYRRVPSEQIIQKIQTDEPRLFKKLFANKKDPIDTANSLLSELSQEGWLIYQNNKWTFKKSSKHCRYCAVPLQEVYIRNEKGARFCSTDCYEELDEDQDDNPYWEDYLYLFEYFRNLYPFHWLKRQLAKLKQMNSQELTFFHLDILKTNIQLDQVFEEDDFLTVERLEGNDGPVAKEMYRILSLLRREQIDFEHAEKIVRKRRGEIKELYGVSLNTAKISDDFYKSNDWKEFKQKNRRFKVKDSFCWITGDVLQRNDWFNELTSILGSEAVGYENVVQCTICLKLEDSKFARYQADQFRYCEACTDEYRIIFEQIK